jgi:hypothetical protein
VQRGIGKRAVVDGETSWPVSGIVKGFSFAAGV